ncbi:hypothetical protein K469DRAFT_653097 [Zopfia rhizophila CBS 207.26]|uniref:Rhodopsin domain-containing protein n=1 Tax=Zopfia rhizophila CBS 207.26 TaxID=1314779 RepID=A0A6A6ETJ0_9PEZI|nr:hypothetical protein K469DRAFT_653097 [Zopfia rhizophila CBS 207.26]
MVLSIAHYSVELVACHYGLGRHIWYVSKEDIKILRVLNVPGSLFWLWSANLTRMSISLMLLRLKETLAWRRALWTLVGVQGFCIISTTVVQFANCIPARAFWEVDVENAKCMPPIAYITYGWTYTIIATISDFVLGSMPFTFLLQIHRPIVEKIVLGFLMTAGLFAGIISIVRCAIAMKTFSVVDVYPRILKTLIYTTLEQYIGIIAACLPLIKQPVHRTLRYFGILPKNPDACDRSPNSFLDAMANASHIAHQLRGIALFSLTGSKAGVPPSTSERSKDGSKISKTDVNSAEMAL